jgi:hypothetical protein
MAPQMGFTDFPVPLLPKPDDHLAGVLGVSTQSHYLHAVASRTGYPCLSNLLGLSSEIAHTPIRDCAHTY